MPPKASSASSPRSTAHHSCVDRTRNSFCAPMLPHSTVPFESPVWRSMRTERALLPTLRARFVRQPIQRTRLGARPRPRTDAHLLGWRAQARLPPAWRARGVTRDPPEDSARGTTSWPTPARPRLRAPDHARTRESARTMQGLQGALHAWPLRIAANARRTPAISCEAVPASNPAGAGMRRHFAPRNGAAESFVSFIASFDDA